MKKLTAVFLVLLLPVATANAMCGIPPIPPIPPIGTSHCEPVCECDATGSECHYTFHCY